jgi:hypothetical protein
MGPMTRATIDRGAAALAALAAWAAAVPWLARAAGQELDVSTRLEVIDHVVPGAVVLACCALLLRPGAAAPGSLARMVPVAIAILAGFWITVTHITLVPEALDGVSPWGAALLHLSAGPPIMLLALWMLVSDPARR